MGQGESFEHSDDFFVTAAGFCVIPMTAIGDKTVLPDLVVCGSTFL